MKILESGKMTKKGQLTIPSDLREHWGLNEGDRVTFVMANDGSVIVEPKVKTSLKDTVGVLKTDLSYDEELINKALRNKFGSKKSNENEGGS